MADIFGLSRHSAHLAHLFAADDPTAKCLNRS
jgi:hypothetical protein